MVAREVLLALPHEMPLAAHRKAVGAFCGWLVGRYGVAADAALHTPKSGHDARNIHAHVLMTTRRLAAHGLGEKTRELDDNRLAGPLRSRPCAKPGRESSKATALSWNIAGHGRLRLTRMANPCPECAAVIGRTKCARRAWP